METRKTVKVKVQECMGGGVLLSMRSNGYDEHGHHIKLGICDFDVLLFGAL